MFKINIINLDGFDKELKEEIEVEKRKIALYLSRIGEEYVNEAKESGNYQDHTKNLRNANSYRVYIDGKVVHESMAGQRRISCLRRWRYRRGFNS